MNDRKSCGPLSSPARLQVCFAPMSRRRARVSKFAVKIDTLAVPITSGVHPTPGMSLRTRAPQQPIAR
jgi:hypothetical protein